jgi:PASTA domain-containing protein
VLGPETEWSENEHFKAEPSNCLTGGANRRWISACLIATAVSVIMATGFGSGVAHALPRDKCIDNAPSSGFSFTCNFTVTSFELVLGAVGGQTYDESFTPSVPGFSCGFAQLTYLVCNGGSAPAGQPVIGKVKLSPATPCQSYLGGANDDSSASPRGANWNGTVCDSGSSGSSGSTGGGTPKHACVVPRLVGKTLNVARGALKAAGCMLGKVKLVKASHTKRSHVLSQSPAAGRHLSAGARVNVAVGR